MSQPTPDERAADWLIRRDRGLTPAEQDDYLQWLAADPRHGDALARQQTTWRELDLLADWRPEHAPEPNPSLLAPPRPPASRPLCWIFPFTLAAAACLAFVLLLNRETQPSTRTPPTPLTVATGYEKRLLDDGSVLELNRGAAVAVAYTATERRVQLLRGEAHFTVAKNSARPFVVSAAGVETRAVGTVFNVRLAAASVEVLVTEGKVAVSGVERVDPNALTSAAETSSNPSRQGQPAPPRDTFVAARERLTIPLAPASPAPATTVASVSAHVPVAVSSDEIARSLAWQPRLLEFSAAPLAEVVAEFNRHNTIQLALADPALASFPVTASFRSDNAEGFVRLLEATAGVRAERRGETISLRRAISP
jgi:transmembrane sensor